jgi:hypothetical protein
MIRYSLDDEYFKYDTYLGAIFEMESPKVGDVYYSCEAIPVNVERLVREYFIDSLLESIDDELYDEIANEDCFLFKNGSREAKLELHDMIVQWTKKNTAIESYFTFVGKSTKHFVTEEDLKELNDD